MIDKLSWAAKDVGVSQARALGDFIAMRHYPILLAFILAAGSVSAAEFTNVAAEKLLPEGAGLAAAFKADAKLQTHPDVIFADDFESGALGERWDETGNKGGKVLSFAEPGLPNLGRRCMRVESHLGVDTGGGLTKWFEAADTVFVRFYTKFDPACDYVHHFVTLRANRALSGRDKWSGFGGAGLKPKGDERFSTAIEPWGNWGRNPPPGRWNFYSYWHEMAASRDGMFWGNSFAVPDAPVIPRGQWICVEFMLKHNTPGQPDGEQAFWIDGKLLGHWKGINWRRDGQLKANALTLETYITDRWTKQKVNVVSFDNAVIARRYIGPASVGDQARLVDPPADSRIIKIIHNWPDDPKAQDQWMDRLQAQGFGGVVCNVSGDQYLESDAKWKAFVRAVNEARRRGMAMWLYDERGYPSGNAGGLVLRDHPEWEARGLLVANKETGAGQVELVVPPGKLVLAAAFPVRDGAMDLSARLDLAQLVHDGRLVWDAPEGRWQVMAVTEDVLYEGTHADGNLHQKMPYVNLLMPEPTARFIEVTHTRYARHLGPDLGRFFMGTFTDEPSLMSCFLKPMPFRPLPWASNLPDEFRKRRGYALDVSIIPALIADAGPSGARHRYDFWLTVGELVSENFFGQIQTWCRQHNVPSGGHLLMEEGLVSHVPFYGDFFRCARRLDAPSIDCLTSIPGEVPWYIARLLASAAELDGRTLVMSETSDHGQVWRPQGDARPKRIVTEAEIRGTCNRLIVSGVNSITSYYSFSELTDEQLRRINEWVGRSCALLRGGQRVADIAVLYPVESIWTKFTPARHWANESPGAARIENLYRGAIEALFAAQRDFTFIDSRTLAEASADSGALKRGELEWRVLVLPGVDTLPLDAWENLARFVRSGGVAITLGALPSNSEREFPSARVQALGKELFGNEPAAASVVSHGNGGAGICLPAGSEGLLPLVIKGVIEPDVSVRPERSPVRVTHREIDGRQVYFVINDSAKPWEGTIEFAAHGLPEQVDLAPGLLSDQPAGGPVSLRLEPYGASVFRFTGRRAPKRHPVAAGTLPNLVCQPRPPASSTLAHGEFVSGTLSPRAEGAGTAEGWTTSAVVRKSQVDTYLFARLHYPSLLDLTQADCLALESWVPEGQAAPTQILVILHEKDGGDFLASTGRSLGAAGRDVTYLPFTRFQLAGWSKDQDGELDLARVDEVRIGWGGYLGTEGEKIAFSFAIPQSGNLRAAPPE